MVVYRFRPRGQNLLHITVPGKYQPPSLFHSSRHVPAVDFQQVVCPLLLLLYLQPENSATVKMKREVLDTQFVGNSGIYVTGAASYDSKGHQMSNGQSSGSARKFYT